MSDIKDEVTTTPVESLLWKNQDNNIFYETIKSSGLENIANKGGLSSGCDIDEIKPFWLKAKNILEIGAGYGRVIDHLLTEQYRGFVTAIERCNSFYDFLVKKYESNLNVYLIHGDILYVDKLHLDNFDLILMLWSGIADFTPDEQKMIFSKLFNLLSDTGNLIIDTMPANTTPLDMKHVGTSAVYKLEMQGVCINTYSMSLDEIDEYGHLAGFSNIQHKKYKTDIGRERLLHILS